ncbi:MAG: DUF2892 domain-containing protein [Pseudomonadota bacterium]
MAINTNCNMGKFDRVLRTGIGLLLIYFGFIDTSFIGEGLIAALVGVFGVINVLAALVGICPLYKLAGICTYRSDKTAS